MRRRGLKLKVSAEHFDAPDVASRAEAWIETCFNPQYIGGVLVASRAEAWIETSSL